MKFVYHANMESVSANSDHYSGKYELLTIVFYAQLLSLTQRLWLWYKNWNKI